MKPALLLQRCLQLWRLVNRKTPLFHWVVLRILSLALIPSAVALEGGRYVRNEAVWRTPPIRPQGFQFEIQLPAPTASYDLEIVRQSIRGHNLGDYDSAVSKVMAAEWGYSFTHLDGQTDGAGRRIRAGYATPPTNRAECLKVIESFLHQQYIRGAASPVALDERTFPLASLRGGIRV